DPDQRHACSRTADLHELSAGAAADVGDHVALARRELIEQRAAPARRPRERDDQCVVEPQLRRRGDVVALRYSHASLPTKVPPARIENASATRFTAGTPGDARIAVPRACRETAPRRRGAVRSRGPYR